MPAQQASYVEFLGPLLIGVTGNAIVFGICCMQLVTYITSKYNDSPKLRLLIAWVYAVDIFQVWQSTWTLWHYTVANFDNPAALSIGPWEYASLPIFGALAIVPIQLFMATRIMKFAQSRVLFYVIAFGSITQAALACSAASLGMVDPAVSNHVNIMPLADAWLGFAVVCDSTITGLLLYYLLKSRTGVRKTDSIIRRLCSTTVEAAVPVVLLSLGDLLALTVSPTSNFHYMFALPVGRLYTNTLMVTLNDRKRLRTQMEHWSVNSIHLSKINTSPYHSTPHPHMPNVNVNVSIDVDAKHHQNCNPIPVHLSVRTVDLLKTNSDMDTRSSMLSPMSALSETSTEFAESCGYAVGNLEKFEKGGLESKGEVEEGPRDGKEVWETKGSSTMELDLEKGCVGGDEEEDDERREKSVTV